MGLLLEKQRNFDLDYFDRPTWEISDWRGQKTRHIGHHILKANLKVCDGTNRQIRSEVLPDLAIYRAQLMNLHELPEDMLEAVKPDRASDGDVVRELARASGKLAYYIEPAEHDAVADGLRLEQVSYAVTHLHVAVGSLARLHMGPEDKLEDLHLQRLAFLEQHPALM